MGGGSSSGSLHRGYVTRWSLVRVDWRVRCQHNTGPVVCEGRTASRATETHALEPCVCVCKCVCVTRATWWDVTPDVTHGVPTVNLPHCACTSPPVETYPLNPTQRVCMRARGYASPVLWGMWGGDP